MSKYFKRVSELRDEVLQEKNSFGVRGWSTGLPEMDDIISYRKGYSTVVFSYAHHGKTQIVIDNCVYLAREYGVRTAFYLTEAGKAGEAILDVMQTLVGKSLPNITDGEFEKALQYMDKYFFFADISKRLTDIDSLYEEIALIKKEVDIGNIVIDHFHQLEDSQGMKFMDRADKTKYTLRAVSSKSRILDVHTFIMFHVKDKNPIQCPTSKLWYLPKPEKEELSGGQQSSYLGYNMISIWRPVMGEDKLGIVDTNGIPYRLNESIITCAKVKPKGSARLGSRRIFFDVEKQRYYCEDGGKKVYAVDSLTKGKTKILKESAMKPNLDFGTKSLPF